MKLDFQEDSPENNTELDFQLDFQEEKVEESSPVVREIKRRGKAAIGGIDAAVSMAGSLPAYAAGGLMGLGTLLSGQGLDKAADTAKRIGESNFGLGAPKPFTQEGQEVMDMTGELMEGAIGKTNEYVSKVAGDKAGNLAAFGAEMALNLAPIPGYKGVKKIAKAVERKPAAKPNNAAADVIAEAKAKQEALKTRRVDIDLSEGPGIGDGAVVVGKDGTARVPNENPGLTEAYKRQQAAETAARSNETAQTELFDQPEQGRVANPYEAKLGDWRVDENGMPIKVDLSMEAQNLENPLQQNLWGDENPMTRNTVGQNANLFDESQPPVNDVPLTSAIDSMPPGPERDAAIARLQHDIQADGPLERAKMDAETPQGGSPLLDTDARTPTMSELKLNMGKGGRQHGAIDPQVFKEGYKGLTRALSKLTDILSTDHYWQQQMFHNFGDKDMMRNADGSPMVMLHGTTADIRGELRTSNQGVHAGFTVPSHMFVTYGDSIRNRKPYHKPANTKENAQMYPIAIKKGNYPFLPWDAGDWTPSRMLNSGEFVKWFNFQMSEKGYTPTQIKSFKNYVENATTVEEMNQRFMDVLKRVDVDGFFYRNEAESAHAHKKDRLKSSTLPYEEYTRKTSELSEYSQDPISFVTWDATRIRSIYNFTPESSNAPRTIRSPGNRQMGGIYMGAEPTPPSKKRLTPEEIAARSQQRKVAERMPLGKGKLLDEFTDITTKEEAVELGKTAKDISTDYGQKQLGAGIGFHAAMSNNPVLKFARYAFREARVTADKFSRRYITDNKTGLTPLWSQMTDQERVNTMSTLMEGDKQQFIVNEEIMDKLGFNDRQRQFVKSYYEANETLWTRWEQSLAENGLKVPPKRTGHFPGIFTGSYKTLVMVPKLDNMGNPVMKNGKPLMETAGVIGADTSAQRKAAMEYFKKEFPNAKFIEQQRSGLSGSAPRYYSNIFSGMNDMLEMLGKEDPRFADVQALVQDAIVEANNKLFNFNVHELAKKGVIGNEGNRPWLDAKQNANDAFHALVRYFEEGALHHELQIPLKEMRELANSPELSHLPNTMKYLDAYTKKVTGADLSPIGAAINTFLDAPFKVMPHWTTQGGKLRVGVGVGPGAPLKISGAIKNNMSQLFMGYGNYMFTLSQLIQPGQTGLPFMSLAAERLGLSQDHAVRSMASGGNNALLAFAEEVTGKRIDVLPEHMRTAWKYAGERGLRTFSEMERAYQGTQSRLSRAKDRAAEANMKVGENATRTPMFMAYTDLLVKSGIPVDVAMPIAEHMTQFSMVDYHQWERPMLYSKMGVIGQFAGGLQTFKHGILSQQAYLARQAIKPAVGKHQVTPIMLSVAAMLTLAGITGLPGYNEMDSAVLYLTDKFGGEAKNIRELFLMNNNEMVNSGVVSNLMDLNIQNKFSAADMLGDSIPKVLSPHLDAFSKIVASAIDMAKTGADPQSVRNFLLSSTPSGLKGFTESAVARDEDNNLVGRDGLPAVPRTDKEWEKRKWTGLRPQREAIERETTWTARIKERKDIERKQEIVKEYERRLINNTLDKASMDKLQDEYRDRGGDLKTLLELHKTTEVQKQQTQKERMQGIPKSAGGVRRWEYYNK